MNTDKLSELLEVYLTVHITKELPRQGFLHSGFKINEADSVAAHSFSVCIFSYLLAQHLKKEGWDIDSDKVLKIALVHDLGEAITGDIGTYAKDLAREAFHKIENQAFKLLIRNMDNKEELVKYFEEYQKLETKEAQLVKMVDALDAFIQGFNTPSANLEDLKKTVYYIAKKKIKDKKLFSLIDNSIKLISEKKVGVYKGYYGEGEK